MKKLFLLFLLLSACAGADPSEEVGQIEAAGRPIAYSDAGIDFSYCGPSGSTPLNQCSKFSSSNIIGCPCICGGKFGVFRQAVTLSSIFLCRT